MQFKTLAMALILVACSDQNAPDIRPSPGIIRSEPNQAVLNQTQIKSKSNDKGLFVLLDQDIIDSDSGIYTDQENQDLSNNKI